LGWGEQEEIFLLPEYVHHYHYFFLHFCGDYKIDVFVHFKVMFFVVALIQFDLMLEGKLDISNLLAPTQPLALFDLLLLSNYLRLIFLAACNQYQQHDCD